MKFSVATMLLAALVTLSGCSTLSEQRRVGVAVIDVEPEPSTLFESKAKIILRFTNANPSPISLKGASHQLFLNGSLVGRAVTNELLTLPALGTVSQSLEVFLDNVTLVRKAAEFSRSPSLIEYRLESELFTSDDLSLKSTVSGQLDLKSLLEGYTGFSR